MIKNYILTALRNILRQKGFSFINIFGLALGLACTLLILLWVQDEISYDRFHENLEYIYRVEEDQYYSGATYHVTVTPYPSGPVWAEKIPEIREAVRLQWSWGMLFRYGEKAFYEDGMRAVDSNFFQVFTFPLIKGNPETSLTEPYSMVLTEEMAEKYFGEEDPMGLSLQVNKYQFIITGVTEDVPHNSSIQFDFLVPFDFMKVEGRYTDHWDSNSILTYARLEENADPGPVDGKLTEIYKENLPEGRTDFMLASLEREHLYSYWGYQTKPYGIQFVYIFSFIAAFVLLVACINFMNLSTAKSSLRAKEIGIRKVVGAKRGNLINQFYGESLILSIIAMVFAIGFVALLLGLFNTLSSKEVDMNVLLEIKFIIGIIVITLITTFIAGSYPALLLSAFKPVVVMKGETVMGMKKGSFRKILVVLQFTISIVMIIGTVVVYNQLHYMRGKYLGFDREQLVYIFMRGDINNAYERIKGEFEKSPHVVSVSGTQHSPINFGSNSGGVEWPGKDPELRVLITTNHVDFGFLETMKIEVAEGRNFNEEFVSDRADTSTSQGVFMINETLANIMDLDTIIGLPFKFMGWEGPIIGIMKDFHYHRVNNKIMPLAMVVGPTFRLNFIVFRILPGDISRIMNDLEKIWEEVIPGYPFEYSFVDEDLEALYRSQEMMGRLLKYFAIVAIIVACLGLSGLASFTAEQRTKEFGIRKAMGASGNGLIVLISRQFSILVFISIIISCPIAWFFMNKWLQDFAYRDKLNWWIFVLAAIFSLAVALISVIYQAIKVSQTNPANALRYE
ncbi:hypothetical protein ES705_27741 [subsurface metagenome]